MTTLIRNQYEGRVRRPSVFQGKRLVEQQYKKVVDTHEIVKRFTRTGVFDHTTNKKPMFGDFSKLQGFHQAQNMVAQTTQYFEGLPSDLRKQFNNSVSEFAQFMSNPENMEKAQELGLVQIPQPEKPITVPTEPTTEVEKTPIVAEEPTTEVEKTPIVAE